LQASACARAGALGLAVLALALPPLAGKLGGPYFIEDAEIGPVGSCETEQWAASAHNGDHIYVASPACVVGLGAPVEIGASLFNFRSDGVVDPVVALSAKTVPIPLPGGGLPGFGLALSGTIAWDMNTKSLSNLFINIPLSYDFSPTLRLNVNVGALYNADPSLLIATAGHYCQRTGRSLKLDHVMAWHLRSYLGEALWRSEAGLPLLLPLPGGGTASDYVDQLSERFGMLRFTP